MTLHFRTANKEPSMHFGRENTEPSMHFRRDKTGFLSCKMVGQNLKLSVNPFEPFTDKFRQELLSGCIQLRPM